MAHMQSGATVYCLRSCVPRGHRTAANLFPPQWQIHTNTCWRGLRCTHTVACSTYCSKDPDTHMCIVKRPLSGNQMRAGLFVELLQRIKWVVLISCLNWRIINGIYLFMQLEVIVNQRKQCTGSHESNWLFNCFRAILLRICVRNGRHLFPWRWMKRDWQLAVALSSRWWAPPPE